MPRKQSDQPKLLLQRHRLRNSLRQQRRTLSPAKHKMASCRCLRQILQLPAYRKSRSIALYLPNDGEIDISGLLKHAHLTGKKCFLPVVKPTSKNLAFVRLKLNSHLKKNRYGILEPFGGEQRHPRQLDLVLTPLVGFDNRGNRLGMGGGYYDKTFQFKQLATIIKPKLIGVAHEFQQVEQLTKQRWDVCLEWVITDRRRIHCNRR